MTEKRHTASPVLEFEGTRPRQIGLTAGLTKKFIESVPSPARGRRFYHDQERGLSLCVRESGHKSWYWQRKLAGRPQWKMLGLWPETSIEEARNRARELNTKRSDWRKSDWTGPSPFEAPRTKLTFAELSDLYLAKHIRQHAVHPEEAAYRFDWMRRKYLSSLGGRPLASITGQVLRDLHSAITEKNGRVAADRVIQLVRRVYFWGIKKERVYTGPNPATEVNFNGSVKRDRYLRSDELARLFAALRQEPSADLRDFVVISLFCGSRKSDTWGMRWVDLSLEDHVWRVPLPKGGRPYLIPLVPEVIEILEERLAHSSGSEWVFPSPAKRGAHVYELKHRWKALLERAQISNFTVHDMRRTFGSFQAGQGTSVTVIGKSLGHQPGSSATSVYERLDLQTVKDSVMRATRLMLAAAKPERKRRARRAQA